MTVPDVMVEIAFESQANPAAWSLGSSAFPVTLGAATLDAWTDVTAAAKSVRITRGKTRELDAYQVGRCVVDFQNVTRDFDPLNLSGPYVSGGVTLVKPGKPIRVRATDPTTSTVYYLFRGTIRDWDLNYSPTEFEAIAQALASDALADIANAGVSVTTSAAPSGTVVQEVLADAGIGALNVDSGDYTLQVMTFSGTAGAALRVIEQTEQGHVISEAEGGISFKQRSTLILDTRSTTSQATFGGVSGLPYESIDVAYESDAIKNKARVTRMGGVQQEATNASSIAAYGERVLVLTGTAHASDAEALSLAQYLVGFRGEPAVRFKSLVCAPPRSDAVMTTALSTQLLDRMTVAFIPPGASSPTSQDVFVIGVEHQWEPPGAMRTTFRLMPTDAAIGWVLGVGELGDTTGPTATVLGY